MEDNKKENAVDRVSKEYRRSLNIWRSIAAVLAIALIGTGVYAYMTTNDRNYYKPIFKTNIKGPLEIWYQMWKI